MAKGPAKKAANKSVRPVGKAPAKPAAKAKVVAPKAKPQKIVVAKPSKPSKPVPQAPRMMTPPTPAPAPISVVKAPSVEAVAAFEKGMNALQRHDYKTASSAFQVVLDGFGGEGFIADRARVYQELATRELRKRQAGTGNIEERLTAATLALNNNNDEEAARLAADVLKEDRSQDLAAYLLAVISSRRGDVDAALAHLRNAISINPECRLQARQDEEFDPLMDSDDFHTLIEAPSATGSSNAAALSGRPVRKAGR
jgi:tetratricopeptide (TPR) repeat protein